MFSSINRFLNNVVVKESNDTIEIDGIPADLLSRDIYKHWSTSKINKYLFTQVTRNRWKFQKFFALEVLYILESIINDRYLRASKSAIRKTVEELKSNTWLASVYEEHAPILDFSKISGINVELKPHQLQFLHEYNHNVPRYKLSGYLLAAPPGAGKTLTGLALGLCLDAEHVLVVAPKNAVYDAWVDTIKTKLKGHQTYWVAASREPMRGLPKYLIYHYETLDDALEITHQLKDKRLLILLDESHNLNESSSQRSQKFIELCAKTNCRNVVWSSGTAIKAVGSEAIPMLKTIDPYFNNDVEERFKLIFGKNASQANDIINHRLGTMSFKVDKQVVMGTLAAPENVDIKVKVPNSEQYTLQRIREEMKAFILERMAYYHRMMPEIVKQYDECIAIHKGMIHSHDQKSKFGVYQDYIKTIRRGYDPVTMKELGQYCNWYELTQIIPTLPPKLKETFRDIRSVIKYVELKVQGECLGRVLGKRRIDCNLALVPHANLDKLINDAVKKTIIFTSFVEVLKGTVKYLDGHHYDPVVVYGDTNKDLTGLIDRFKRDKHANPIVATYQSLSTAVTLIEASTIILMNQPFREGEREQAISRANRLGQDTQVTTYNILLDTGNEPNISTRSQEILAWSKQQVAEIMGIKPQEDVEVTLESYVEPNFVSIELPKYMQW